MKKKRLRTGKVRYMLVLSIIEVILLIVAGLVGYDLYLQKTHTFDSSTGS